MVGPRHILVPVHASRSSRAALDQARRLAAATGARLRVLEVRPLRARAVEPLAFDESAACAFADDMPELSALQADVRIVDGDPLQVILAEASEPDVDLLVIGHGERGWIARGMTSPLHQRVVRWCRCPVMVVQPDLSPAASPSPVGGELSRAAPSRPSGVPHLRVVR